MKRKIVRRVVSSPGDVVRLVSGVYTPQLTDKETEVLAAFVDAHVLLQRRKLEIGTFSTAVRKKVAKRLGREDHSSLNFYIKKLKDKGAIREDAAVAGGYQIHPLFVPSGETEIVLKLIKPEPKTHEPQRQD